MAVKTTNWTGLISAVWALAGNWSNGVPAPGDTVGFAVVTTSVAAIWASTPVIALAALSWTPANPGDPNVANPAPPTLAAHTQNLTVGAGNPAVDMSLLSGDGAWYGNCQGTLLTVLNHTVTNYGQVGTLGFAGNATNAAGGLIYGVAGSDVYGAYTFTNAAGATANAFSGAIGEVDNYGTVGDCDAVAFTVINEAGALAGTIGGTAQTTNHGVCGAIDGTCGIPSAALVNNDGIVLGGAQFLGATSSNTGAVNGDCWIGRGASNSGAVGGTLTVSEGSDGGEAANVVVQNMTAGGSVTADLTLTDSNGGTGGDLTLGSACVASLGSSSFDSISGGLNVTMAANNLNPGGSATGAAVLNLTAVDNGPGSATFSAGVVNLVAGAIVSDNAGTLAITGTSAINLLGNTVHGACSLSGPVYVLAASTINDQTAYAINLSGATLHVRAGLTMTLDEGTTGSKRPSAMHLAEGGSLAWTDTHKAATLAIAKTDVRNTFIGPFGVF